MLSNAVIVSRKARRLAGSVAASLATYLLCALYPLTGSASEGGALGNYGVGALTVGSGFAPPEGTTSFSGYILYYASDKFRDGNGNGNVIPGFKLNLVVEAIVLKHTWNFKVAGLNVSSGLLQEGAHVDLEAGGQRSKATGNWAFGIQPLILSGAIGNLHYLTGSYFFLPAGKYRTDSMANATLNYFGYSQDFAVTWLPSPQWMLDLSTGISINGSNHKTDYRSGNHFDVTYGAQYRLPTAPKWQIGFSGLYFNQYQDDKVNGDKVPGGFRLRKITGGPQIGYWLSPAAAVIVKWHHEFDVRNGPQGEQFWLQASVPI